MGTIQESAPRRRRFPIVGFAIGFSICNVVTPLLMEATEQPTRVTVCIVGPFFGAVIASQCLLTVWAVFGPLSILVRLFLALLLAELLLASIIVGVAVVDLPIDMFFEMVAGFCFLPAVFLAAQLPLWGVKLATGGRIVRVDASGGESSTEGRQFGLRHVMGATVVVAVALSLAECGASLLDSSLDAVWIPAAIVCGCCVLWNTFAALPCLWAAMVARRKVVAALMIGVYAAMMTMLLVGAFEFVPGGAMPGETVLMFFVFHFVLAAVILGTLHVARLCGYTFISRHRPQPNLPADCPFAIRDDPSEGAEAAEPPAPMADEPSDSAGPSA